jgi:hypothetical protein
MLNNSSATIFGTASIDVMDALVAILLVGSMLVAVLVVVRRRPKHRRTGFGPMINVFDEFYHPSGRNARVEIEAYAEHTDPQETPDQFRGRRGTPTTDV